MKIRDTHVIKVSEVGSESHVILLPWCYKRYFTDHILVQVLFFCRHVIVTVEYQLALGRRGMSRQQTQP